MDRFPIIFHCRLAGGRRVPKAGCQPPGICIINNASRKGIETKIDYLGQYRPADKNIKSARQNDTD
jgi:hypothetical protein